MLLLLAMWSHGGELLSPKCGTFERNPKRLGDTKWRQNYQFGHLGSQILHGWRKLSTYLSRKRHISRKV